VSATITVDTRREIGRIDRHIYGHFLEGNFFGNIHGGIFDEGSPQAIRDPGVAQGLRRDTIEVCRALGLPVVRWPGGNYASAYHWEDGIGPRDQRPRRLELTWGLEPGNPLREEDNRFGTDEFLAWCALTGAEPYLNTNGRSVEEAVRWLEYTNYAGDTHYTRLRAANGHPEPYGVTYWGIGNEVYGAWQMGHRTVEQYAADAREHALFIRKVDPAVKLIAVGHADEAWTRQVLARAGTLVDYLSIHFYGATTQLADQAGEYEAIVAQSLYFEQELRAYADLVAAQRRALGLERPLALTLDEWNMRHLEPAHWPAPQPGDDGGIAPREVPAPTRSGGPAGPAPRIAPAVPAGLVAATGARRRWRVTRWSPRTLADALFYAGVFQALQRLCGLAVPVRMANTVNLINANAPIVVRPGGVVKAATYHVWDLYQNHTGSIALPVTVEGPSVLAAVRSGARTDAEGTFLTRPGVVPFLDVAATLSADRRALHVSVINRHRDGAIAARLIVDRPVGGGALPPRARALQLGARVDDPFASNSLTAPEHVALEDLGDVDVAESTYTFPAHSLTLLSFQV
jgi:alpha-N-arabinofuranosidase